MLGSTLERVTLPDDLVARLEGKSSLGRLGLLIHSTAGFIDPGLDGHVTLELSNVANLPITIYPGMKIGQLSFMQMAEPADRPYGSAALGSKYQGQAGADAEPVLEELHPMILVTGATGFIGRHVVRALAPTTRVRALVRDARGAAGLAGLDCELAKGDVTDLASLRAATSGCKAVVHLVAIIAGKPEDFERVIARGTRNLVEASQEAGVRRIVSLSALGTGRPGYDAVPYYRAKLEGERAVAGSRMQHVMLRPSFVFGPDGGALPRFLRLARLSPVTPVVGSGRQRIQPIWVDDVVRAIELALPLDGPSGATVELGGPDVVDWNAFWDRVEGSARDGAAGGPPADVADAVAGGAPRAAAEAAADPRPAPNARARRQQVSDGRRGDARARPRRPRPARRAAPARRGTSCSPTPTARPAPVAHAGTRETETRETRGPPSRTALDVR